MIEPATPIVCDMTGAPDTAEERLATYHQLFADALIARERTETGIRFRFRSAAGVEHRVRSLAALEKACCAFFEFTIVIHGDEVWWDSEVVDDPMARQILDEMYALPDHADLSTADLHDRFAERGLVIVTDDNGVKRPATPEEIGLRQA